MFSPAVTSGCQYVFVLESYIAVLNCSDKLRLSTVLYMLQPWHDSKREKTCDQWGKKDYSHLKVH